MKKSQKASGRGRQEAKSTSPKRGKDSEAKSPRAKKNEKFDAAKSPETKKKGYKKPIKPSPVSKKYAPKRKAKPAESRQDGRVRINKYLADAGICSRRDAEQLVKSGAVEINGEVITDLSTRVGPEDVVKYGGGTLRKEKLRYVLLNKPKDYITTSEDPQGRKTVMTLIQDACKERIYPVGRLDRNTTGLLLFTNDGEMAKKLTHPRYGVKKVYLVEADKKIEGLHRAQMIKSVPLEDGEVHFDEIAYASKDGNNRSVIVGLRSGKNRVVRRIFEHFGYEVVKLDRIAFAGITKGELTRGKWRHLTEKEIGFLKMVK